MTIHRTLRAVVGPTLYVQAAWAVLAAIWNVAGVYLIGQGLRAPGPTASLGAAALLLGIASLLLTAVSRWPWAYLLGSAAAGLMGLSAVVLDGAGFFAAASGVLACFRWRVMQVGD